MKDGVCVCVVVCVCGGVSCPRLMGLFRVTRICCTARREWQWWALWAGNPEFSTLPNSLGEASFPLTRRGDVVSAEVRQSLSYSHSFTSSFAHSFPLPLFFLLEFSCALLFFLSVFFPLIFSLPGSFSFASFLSFALWHLHSFSPFNSLFCPLVLFLQSLEWQFWSACHQKRAGGRHLPGFLDLSLIRHHLSTSKAPVLRHASEEDRAPWRAVLSPHHFAVYALDFSFSTQLWPLGALK